MRLYKTPYTIAVRDTGETRLLTSSEGDASAYLFDLQSDAEQFAAHLSDAETFQMAEVAIPRQRFQQILRRIERLKMKTPRPVPG